MTNTPRWNESLLDEALQHISSESRYYVVDALAAVFHNEGHALAGNTEATDADWLARCLWQDVSDRGAIRWDGLDSEERRHWRQIAEATFRQLPLLMERIADRVLLHARVLRQMARAEDSAKTAAARRYRGKGEG